MGEAWALALAGASGAGASCPGEASYLDRRESLVHTQPVLQYTADEHSYYRQW